MTQLEITMMILPILIAVLLSGIWWRKGKGNQSDHWVNLSILWFVNFAMANLYFSWAWRYADNWRMGIMVVAWGGVLFLSTGQLLSTIQILKLSQSIIWGKILLLLFFIINLPVLTFRFFMTE